MLQHDEEFTRKIMGLLHQAMPTLLKVEVRGNTLRIIGAPQAHEIPTSIFYHMTIKEILDHIGVEQNANNTNL
jgi:hypothetical protein